MQHSSVDRFPLSLRYYSTNKETDMYRIAIAIGWSLLTFSVSSFAMPVVDRVALPGEWSSIIQIKDNSQNHYLLRTSITSDLQSCTSALNDIAPKIAQSDGGAVVYTNRDKTTLNFEKTANAAESRVRVLELKCVPGPYPFPD
jgi:predicted sugar kinase